MIPELGHYALVLALFLALVQATLPLIGAYQAMERQVAAGTEQHQVELRHLGPAQSGRRRERAFGHGDVGL